MASFFWSLARFSRAALLSCFLFSLSRAACSASSLAFAICSLRLLMVSLWSLAAYSIPELSMRPATDSTPISSPMYPVILVLSHGITSPRTSRSRGFCIRDRSAIWVKTLSLKPIISSFAITLQMYFWWAALRWAFLALCWIALLWVSCLTLNSAASNLWASMSSALRTSSYSFC